MLFVPFLICLIIYFAMAFYGFKLQNVVLSLILFLIGYHFSNILFSGIVDNNNLLLVINIGIGLILGSFSVKLYKFSSFMICFLLAFMICIDIIDAEVLQYIIGVILGIILGYLGIKFVKTIVIFITGIYGSFNFISLIFTYFNINNNLVELLIFVILAFIAIKYQYKTNKEV